MNEEVWDKIEKKMHAENALSRMQKQDFIKVGRDEDGRAHVSFVIQSAPVSEVGVNGCQAVDMLEYVKKLFVSLNGAFPCRENSHTIVKIEEALHWQDARTKDREARGVEGKNEE